MPQLILAVAIMLAAVAVAELLRRRRVVDPPTQPRGVVPTQLDPADLGGARWSVVVFTSDTCSTCADVVSKAEVMRCGEVAVIPVSFQARRDLHEKYRIDAVPCTLVVDAQGVVHHATLGPVTATDLWAAVAEARDPGSIDRTGGCDTH